MGLTDEQKKRRSAGVGGSEVAALVGLSPFAGPIDVYEAKVDGREVPDNHHMERGRFFERPTAEWYVHRYGGVLRQVDTVRSRRHPLVIVHPDFLVSPTDVDPGPGTIDLSIKVPGPRTWAQWGEAETDEVPDTALVQVQYEMVALGELYGINRAVVAAPIDGDLRRFQVEADEELQAMLVEAVERFWRDHVEPRRPPEPDGTDRYSEYLARRFPASAVTEPLLPADANADAIAAAYLAARSAREKFEQAEKEERQKMEALLGSARGMEGASWRCTWSAVKGRERLNLEALFAEAGVPKELIERHTSRGEGYRRFTLTEKKGKP